MGVLNHEGEELWNEPLDRDFKTLILRGAPGRTPETPHQHGKIGE